MRLCPTERTADCLHQVDTSKMGDKDDEHRRRVAACSYYRVLLTVDADADDL